MWKVGVVGLGILGGAMHTVFKELCVEHPTLIRGVVGYDKYKESAPWDEILTTDIVFLALPSLYSEQAARLDTGIIDAVCGALWAGQYRGIVVLKSTVEPGVTEALLATHPTLRMVYSPEFCTARTAVQDCRAPAQIILGHDQTLGADMQLLTNWLHTLFPTALITECAYAEAELMKIAINNFYAVKVQFFNEIYAVAQRVGADYEKVRVMMLNNGWINPMHTIVPGPDGQLSYGGQCFPKDTRAFLELMRRLGTPHRVLEATVAENREMRG